MMKSPWMAILALLATAPAAAQDVGAAVFNANCVVCHQSNGEGAPGFAPRLAGTLAERAKTEAGRRYLAQLVVSGMMGPIISGGEKFNDAMPSFAAFRDEDIVAVLGYVLGDLNAVQSESRVTLDHVSLARRRVVSPSEVRRLRESQ